MKPQKTIKNPATSIHLNSSPVIQLIILISSSIISWLPSGAINITCLYLNKYSLDLAVWTTVVFTCFSATINPTVFIFKSMKK